MATHDFDSRKPDRDGRRFALGLHGGTGRTYAERVAELWRVFAEAITDDALRTVTDALLRKARRGDVAAAKLLLEYAPQLSARFRDRTPPDRDRRA